MLGNLEDGKRDIFPKIWNMHRIMRSVWKSFQRHAERKPVQAYSFFCCFHNRERPRIMGFTEWENPEYDLVSS
jgi:hypothetical protein